MEGKEMIEIYSDVPVMRDLIRLREDSRLTCTVKDRIKSLEQGLQLLVLYRFCLRHHRALEDEASRIDATLEDKGLSKIGVLALDTQEFEDWETLSSEWLEEIRSHKPSIRKVCVKFANYMFSNYRFSYYLYAHQLRKLMMYVIVSMANVLQLKVDMNPDEKMKFESLKEKMNSFIKVFEFTRKYWNHCDYRFGHLTIPITTWAWNAACVCLLNWVLDEKEAHKEPELNLMLSKLQQIFYCILPDVTRMCLSCLKATKPSAEERFKDCEIVSRFVEFLLGNLKGYLAEDHFEMILNGMVLLITFLMDPPPLKGNQDRLIFIQVDAALAEAESLIISIVSGEMNEADIGELKNFLLNVFLPKFNTIKEEVRKTYPQLLLDASSFNCPRINIPGLFDSVIENLKAISFHYPNHPIMTIHQGLVLLGDSLKSLSLGELQSEHKELKDLWTKICDVAHQADRTIKSFYLKGSLWADLFCLFEVKEEIMRVLVERIQCRYMNDIDECKTEMNTSPMVPLQNKVQTVDEMIVGFEDKAKDIRDWLTNGSEKLNIISIIGMPGLGKTTLARKVYNDLSIKRHFTKCAWCTVSQSYDSRNLLLDILNDVTTEGDSHFEMDEAELALKLKQCLHGQRYLIVMDDIWGVGAWNALKLSFPDDEIHSRILFTTRIYDVVLSAKSNGFPYSLSTLSEEASWELLKKKLFHDKDCPRDFVEVGEQIAKNCEGLPLAVVLVAGLLQKNVKNLYWWKKVGEKLESRISEQGCSYILELSYTHLPEHLKACFLYFAVFPEDKVIRVQKLTKLWVSEGFIQKQENKDVNIVAKEYVMDLVRRSLLIVTHVSSTGGIKACRIHDLLREFCLAKSEDEHFLKKLHGKNISISFRDALNKHYRVCIEDRHWSSFRVWSSSPLHSLLIYHITDTFQQSGRNSSFFNARFLQVLDMEDVRFQGGFPEGVTTLILLRYLGIWCSTEVIPPTIVKLENLETLRVRTEHTCFFPSKVLNMENLRHFDIGSFLALGLFSKAPRMKNIQSFSCPCLTYGKDAEMFLTKIPKIRKLRCQFGSYPGDGKVITKLDFLEHLESLNATHEGQLWLPSFDFSLPSMLKKLTLSNFHLPWTELSKVAELQHLEVLRLQSHAFEGKWWNAENDNFGKLKYLKLQRLYIEQWSASDENFPSLEKLVVEECESLQEIPKDFGDIPSLNMIQMRWCRSSVVDSAKEIQEQQIEYGNVDFKILIM